MVGILIFMSMMLEKILALKEGGRTKGLLTRFIEDGVKNYVAPGKKGVPRGDLIGFSEAKNKAALLGLTSIERKKQAEIAGVSYDLLLKWRTEDRFIGEVERYAIEFAGIFYQSLEKAVEKFRHVLSIALEEKYPTDLFDDLEFWGFITRDYVVKRVLEGTIKNPEKLLYPAVHCIGIIRKDMRFRSRIERRCILYFIRESREDIATQPEVSKEYLRYLFTMLGAIENWLKEDEC